MNIVDRIIKLINDAGYTQKSFAEKFGNGIKQQTITDWKSNKSNSYYFIIPQLAIFFDVSTDYLLGLTNNPKLTRTVDTYLTENEQDILEILHSIPDERQQIKFIGYMEAEAKKFITNNDDIIADDIARTLKHAATAQHATQQK